MSDTNEHEECRRAAEAYALVKTCDEWGIAADSIEQYPNPASLWTSLANVAGVNPPSDRTKAIVLHILRERANG